MGIDKISTENVTSRQSVQSAGKYTTRIGTRIHGLLSAAPFPMSNTILTKGCYTSAKRKPCPERLYRCNDFAKWDNEPAVFPDRNRLFNQEVS